MQYAYSNILVRTLKSRRAHNFTLNFLNGVINEGRLEKTPQVVDIANGYVAALNSFIGANFTEAEQSNMQFSSREDEIAAIRASATEIAEEYDAKIKRAQAQLREAKGAVSVAQEELSAARAELENEDTAALPAVQRAASIFNMIENKSAPLTPAEIIVAEAESTVAEAQAALAQYQEALDNFVREQKLWRVWLPPYLQD